MGAYYLVAWLALFITAVTRPFLIQLTLTK